MGLEMFNKVVVGDCLEVMKRISPFTVDIVLCDPKTSYATIGATRWTRLPFAINVLIKPSGNARAYLINKH